MNRLGKIKITTGMMRYAHKTVKHILSKIEIIEAKTIGSDIIYYGSSLEFDIIPQNFEVPFYEFNIVDGVLVMERVKCQK